MPKRSALSFGSLSYQTVKDPFEDDFSNVNLFFLPSCFSSLSKPRVFLCFLQSLVSQLPNVTFELAQHSGGFVSASFTGIPALAQDVTALSLVKPKSTLFRCVFLCPQRFQVILVCHHFHSTLFVRRFSRCFAFFLVPELLSSWMHMAEMERLMNGRHFESQKS